MRRLSPLLILALTAALSAQQKPAVTVQLPPKPLLPTSFAGWTATGLPTAEAERYDTSPAELAEFGLTRSASATYTQGSATLYVDAWEFADATGAYGAFSNSACEPKGVCTGKAKVEAIGNGGRSEGTYAAFWMGDTFVSAIITPSSNHLVDDLRTLAKTLPIPVGSKAQPPALPQYLPHDGLEPTTIRYALGPAAYGGAIVPIPPQLVDFSRDAEAVTAVYELHHQLGKLLLIEYPTPQMAAERTQAIQSWLATNTPDAIVWQIENNEGFGNCECPKGLPVQKSVTRSGPIVAIAVGNFSQKDADALANSVHYEAEVTWNHPEGYVSDAWRAAHLYLGIFALAGILCAASVILGLFFGGARAISRVLRGKSASSVQDIEFISLDLGHGGDYKPERPD